MPKWLAAFLPLWGACSSAPPATEVAVDRGPEIVATATSQPADIGPKVSYWSGRSSLGRDVADILSGMESCLQHARAQPDEGASAEGKLARAIAMDACREMLVTIPDADVNLFTPKERRLLELAAGGDTALRTQAEEIQQRRREAWSAQRAELAGGVAREVAPVYRAVDLADSGPPRWRTFARKRLFELARDLGAAAIEEMLPGTRAEELRATKYADAAATGWPP